MLDGLVEGSFFSDTFILSAKVERAFYLIRETGNFCRYLLLQGFPCRGAIASGLLHHRERIIIGPALVDAHRTEQSIAIYPRIVLDQTTREHWLEECATSQHAALKSLVKEDQEDGQYYLDILDPAWRWFLPWTEFVDGGPLDPVPSDPAQFLRAAFTQIKRGLTTTSDEKTRSKYKWLVNRCQRHAAVLSLTLD
jgi:hypothetical protein